MCKNRSYLLPLLPFLAWSITTHAQSSSPTQAVPKKYQAKAPATQPFGAEAFRPSTQTTLRWLGMGGFMLNSRGTTLMLDPMLGGYDMPVMIEMPVTAKAVPHLDAVVVTHADNDHYSVITCKGMASVTTAFHSTQYVASLMKKDGLPSVGHDIDDVFAIGPIRVKVTPADHVWQGTRPGADGHVFQKEDSAGYWIETPDGTIWAPGDTRLIADHHLHMPTPDAIFFDFSDNNWHIGMEGAVKMANAYPYTPLVLSHWGSVDAPDFSPFNGDPEKLAKLIKHPERIRVLAPGQPYTITRVTIP